MPPDCVHTIVGYSIIINCSADGYPPVHVAWRRGDQDIAVQGVSIPVHTCTRIYVTNREKTQVGNLVLIIVVQFHACSLYMVELVLVPMYMSLASLSFMTTKVLISIYRVLIDYNAYVINEVVMCEVYACVNLLTALFKCIFYSNRLFPLITARKVALMAHSHIIRS